MSAMNETSLFAGLAALLGALVAYRYLPGRREFAELHGPRSDERTDETADSLAA
jgi:hypothetical protein